MESKNTSQASKNNLKGEFKVLLVGSGLMTVALLDYLTSFKDTKITVASNILDDAQKMAQKNPQFITATFLDIFNEKQLDDLVKNHDVVISFVPPTMHMPVANSCLKNGKHLVTSSYISPQMEELHAQVQAKDLIFLNECGLDPGIDIMSTMKVVHEAQKSGHKVVGYESYCGGLPIAEQADNPMGYKFSWNPGAGVKASKNKAIYKKFGKVVEAPEPLKVVEVKDDFSVSMKLEVYPNRDSLVFQKKFGMEDCETFVRGTIRFKGFSYIFSGFHDMGLTSDNLVPRTVKSKRMLIESLVSNVDPKSCHSCVDQVINDTIMGISDKDALFIKKVLGKMDISYIKDIKEIEYAYKQMIESIRFFGFLEQQSPLLVVDKNNKERSYLDIFGDIMNEKMSLNDDDIDLVIMRHIFTLEDKNKVRWNHYSTMVAMGSSKK